MRRILAITAAVLATLTLTTTATTTTQASAAPLRGICGTLPVYHATGHESMAAWARAHHAFISTIILSTLDDCTKSGNPIVLRIVRQMDHYVNKGDQHLDMPRGMIFTSPPAAQHHIVALNDAFTCQAVRHVAHGTTSLVAWDRKHRQLMDESLYFSFFCGNNGDLSRPGGFTWPMVHYLDQRYSVMAKMPRGLVFWSALAGN